MKHRAEIRNFAVSVIAGLVVFAVVASGCSGSSTSESNSGGSGKLTAAEFADKTCPDLTAFAKTATDAVTALQDVAKSAGTAAAMRRLSQTYAALDQAAATLASSISGRPAPDVPNGDQIKTEAVDGLHRLLDTIRAERATIDNFDFDHAAASDSESLSGALKSIGSGASEDFSALSFADNSDLASAFGSSKACQEFNSHYNAASS